MFRYEIYLSSLSEKTQQSIDREMKAELGYGVAETNWDVFPIFVLDIEADEEE